MFQTFQRAVSIGCRLSFLVNAQKHIHHSRTSLVFLAKNFCISSYMTSQEDVDNSGIKMKLDTPEFHKLFTPELRQLAELFKQNDFELRIAGGAVRDLLMGLQPKDIDFATTATPQEMKDIFTKEGVRMINTKGESHGTITPRLNDKENFEVTTLRIDVITDGRHAEVEFTKDWKIDAERRDLTINSMFLGLDGTLYDFFGGKEDLEQRKVAFVGNAVSRIQEDYLRILRYFRFYGRIAVEADGHCPKTLEAIRENGHGLSRVSGERIWVEVKKILLGNHVDSLMEFMHELELFQFIGLPLDCDISKFKIVSSRTKGMDPLPMTLLSSLFRDEKDVLTWQERVKPSGDERKLAFFIVEHREDKSHAEPLKPFQNLILSMQNKEKKIIEYVYEVLKYRGDDQLLSQLQKWNIPKFPIIGTDLINEGVPRSRQFGKIMESLKEIWMESNCQSSKEELLKRLPEIKEKFKKR